MVNSGKNIRFAFGKRRSTTAVLSMKSLSGSQFPLRDVMPGLSHFQFWIPSTPDSMIEMLFVGREVRIVKNCDLFARRAYSNVANNSSLS